AFDGPESRPLAERCLHGFLNTSGPPTLPNYYYNNMKQIVQTKDTILILVEMVHDARVIRMNAEHLPPAVRKWMGDSVGRWDGDTLVVDTTNFTNKTQFRGSSENLHVVERFTRVAGRDRELDPVEPFAEHDVGHEHVGRRRPAQQQQRLRRRFGDEHRVAEALELAPHDVAHVGFVLDDEDRPRDGGRRGVRRNHRRASLLRRRVR